MIPISLKFRAFESYAEETYIDFLALDSLFLITGNTGAGKTAILDAITYALYQKTSGGKRDNLVRSQLPQCEKVDTFVEFVFEVKGKKYKFCRTIKKGEKEDKTAECFYYDDIAGEFISFSEKQNSTEVNKKAKEILGLDFDQFKQVIILPQGQFEELLTSKSADKEAILETLFDAKRYSDLSDMLKKQANEQKNKLDLKKAKLDAMLKNEGFDSEIAMLKDIIKHKRELRKLESSLTIKRQNLFAIQKDFNDALMLVKDFNEHDDIKKKLADLFARENEIHEYSNRIIKHQNALNASPLYSKYDTSADTLKKRTDILNECQSVLDNANKMYDTCVLNGKQLKKYENEYNLNKDKLARLMLVKDKYEQFEGVQKKTERLENEFINADNKSTVLSKKLDNIEKNLSEITSQIQDIQTNYIQKLPILETLLNKFNTGKTAYEKYIHYTNELNKIKLSVEKFDKQIASCDDEIKKANKQYNDVFSKHISMLSSELAHQLKDGCECPVCGNKEHPSPAKITNESVSADDVAKARRCLDELNKDLMELKTDKNKQVLIIKNADVNIKEQYEIYQKSEYTPEKLANTELEKSVVDEKIELLEKLNGIAQNLSKDKLDLAKELTQTTEKRNKLNDEYTYSQNELKSIKSQLFGGINTLSEFLFATNKLKEFVSGYEEKRAVHEQNMRTAENNKLNANTAFNIAENEKNNAQNETQISFEKLNDKLKSLGISNINEYENAVLSDDIYIKYQEQIDEFKEKSTSLKSRNDELLVLLKDKIKPDIVSLEKLKIECENDVLESEKHGAVINEKCTRLVNVYKEHKKATGEYAVLFEKNIKRVEFAEFMWGKKGMSFSRYVLGVLFGLVAKEANTLLRSVHNGQFSIYVGSDKINGNSKQGLDLMVENSLSDIPMKYDVKGLSGGEKFLISLALSMGLGAFAQSYSGGIDIDTMFIDEGFGSLDPTSLREAVDILCQINKNRKKIGIISHVDGLAEVISCSINVSKNVDGSRLTIS